MHLEIRAIQEPGSRIDKFSLFQILYGYGAKRLGAGLESESDELLRSGMFMANIINYAYFHIRGALIKYMSLFLCNQGLVLVPLELFLFSARKVCYSE